MRAVHGHLLEATFSADPRTAWETWRDAIDWDDYLDSGSFQLLPLLYRNLNAHGISNPLMARFKGIMRKNWVSNNRLFQKIVSIVTVLQQADINCQVLPPAIPILFDPQLTAPGGIPVRLSVPPSEAASAIVTAGGAGWLPQVQIPRWWLAGYLMSANAMPGNFDGMALQLEWADFGWEDGRQISLLSSSVLVPAPAATLHNLCRFPSYADSFSNLVSILVYLSVIDERIDARRFIELCDKRPIEPTMVEPLREAGELFPDILPQQILDSMPPIINPSLPPANEPAGTFGRRIRGHWNRYHEAGAITGPLDTFNTLPGFLMSEWNLTSPSQLPKRLCQGLRDEWSVEHNKSPTAGQLD